MSTAVFIAFIAAAGALLGGATLVVSAVRSPVTTALGAGLAAFGLAVELALLGAPLVGLLQLTISLAIAVLILLFGTRLIGTGEASLSAPTWGRRAFNAVSLAAALALVYAIATGRPMGDGAVAVVLGGSAGAPLLGQALFRDDLVVVGLIGLLLLVAIVGSVVLASKEAR